MRSFLTRIVLAALMLTSAVSWADEPVPGVQINSEESYTTHAMIVQSLEGLQEVQFRARWVVRSDDGRDDPEVRVHFEARGISVWAPEGRYETICTVGVIGDAGKIDWIDLAVEWGVVSDEDKPLPVAPGPASPPPAGPAAGFGDVADMIVELAGPVRDPEKAESAAIFATAYREHGAKAQNGDYDSQQLLADASSAQYTYSLGLSRYLLWRPMLSELKVKMSEMMKEGRLEDRNMDHWSDLWLRIAEGFDRVAAEGQKDGDTDK